MQEYIDEALQQMRNRAELEKLAASNPLISEMQNELNILNDILHKVSAILQKHRLVVAVDQETGLSIDGYEPELAQQETTDAFRLIRAAALRFQG